MLAIVVIVAFVAVLFTAGALAVLLYALPLVFGFTLGSYWLLTGCRDLLRRRRQ